MYYLASPYSKYPLGRQEAFAEACRYAAALLRLNLPVYSPIVHSHGICETTGLDPLNHEFWMAADKPLADLASGLIVCCMDGWEDSVGVQMEIEWFHADSKPIYYARLTGEGRIHWVAETMMGSPL